MKCPRCAETMQIVERDDVRSRVCPSCNGAWISDTSLHKLFAREEDTPHIEEMLDTFMSHDFRDGKLPCPACAGRRMQTLEVEGVELDYCTGCKGLFFDPGELERVFPSTYRGPAGKPDGTGNEDASLFDTILAFFSGTRR
jgi:Zn-finger nucleic acid-binding protein